MTEILLLGSFHFKESSIDICSEKVQDELDSLVRKLSGFHPDRIAIEAAADDYLSCMELGICKF